VMELRPVKIRNGAKIRVLFVIMGVLINILLSFAVGKLDIPFYMDTVGTMIVTIMGGVFPGVMTAFATNLICTLYSEGNLYFAFINILVAIYTVHFLKRHKLEVARDLIMYVVIVGSMCGFIGAIVEWGVFSGPQNFSLSVMADALSKGLGTTLFASYAIINMFTNIVDKAISIWISLIIIHYIPDQYKAAIRDGVWRQRPLTNREMSDIEIWRKDLKASSRTRMMKVLVGLSFVLVTIMGWIGIKLYFNNAKVEKTEIAQSAVRFGADIIDIDKIDEYIEKGRAVDGYNETEELLYKIRDNAKGVEYMYVMKFEDFGSVTIFDLKSADGTTPYKPGQIVPFDEGFKPYKDKLLAGEEVNPVEQNRVDKWLLTIYYPVKDDGGKTVCYVGADVVLDYMALYMRDFLFRVGVILAGFFMVIVAYGIWTTDVYNAYPVSSLARCVDKFAQDGYAQETLDENVRTLRRLNIYTGDEVEKLYHAICKMTLSQAEQMRNVRRLSDSTAKMQEGLIITMANMVENRDSDTGAHIQKTAAYVRIIAEGLKKKGYYPEKITDKYISDIVRSAPLHDVGKINISDSVLNKPGKLTPEEFEIMKTHTTAGKIIIENAINTVQGENYLKEARNMAAYHHERWDGKGYPEGLHGEVIPLSARIMAVADVFDALTSPRVYKPAFPLDEALDLLKDGAGSQFDPKCIEVFLDSLPEVKVILSKYNKSV